MLGKTRFIISLLGVSFSIILILILLGIYQGFISSSKRFILDSGANICVAQQGIENLYHSFSFVPITLKGQIEKIDGAKEASLLVIRRIVINVKGRQVNLDIIGFDQDTKLGGPDTIIDGKARLEGKEIIIDHQTALTNDLDIGDRLLIDGAKFKIVGITRGQTTGITSFAFVDLDEAQRLFNPPELANFILITTEDAARQEVQRKIGNLSDEITTFSNSKLASQNSRFITNTFSTILAQRVSLAIGTSIVGLITYTITSAKHCEYGLLKAIGASNRWLYLTVFQQSFISGFTRFVIGSSLSFAVAALLEELIVEVGIEQAREHFVLVF